MDHQHDIRGPSMGWLRPAGYAIAICLVFVVCGCRSWEKSHEVAIAQFGRGDVETSRSALIEAREKFRSEKKVLELDAGILDLASGDVHLAENRFRTIRRELEHLEQKDVTEQASSLLTDSRAVAYSGRDFERRMVLNMALLTSLMGDGQDAFAYALQVTEAASDRKIALQEAANKATDSGLAKTTAGPDAGSEITPASYSLNSSPNRNVASPLDQTLALSSYLSAAVQSEQPSRYAETEQAIGDIGYWNPIFARHEQTNAVGEFGTRCAPGNGTLHVIMLVGKAPRWVSESAVPTSASLLIADRIVSATGKHTLPPTISCIKIAKPQPVGASIPVGSLQCLIGPCGSPARSAAPVAFSTVVDLNAVAQASYDEHRDQEIANGIARRVFKKGAVYVLKEAQKVHRNSFVDLGINVAGVAWEAMEQPDTRSWRLLPARIDLARAELKAGQWSTTLQLSAPGASRTTQTVSFHIQDGRNTYIVCMIPEREITGQILVGGADSATIPVNP